MVTHFWPNETLYLLGGGRGWFPNKVKSARETQEKMASQAMEDLEKALTPAGSQTN